MSPSLLPVLKIGQIPPKQGEFSQRTCAWSRGMHLMDQEVRLLLGTGGILVGAARLILQRHSLRLDPAIPAARLDLQGEMRARRD